MAINDDEVDDLMRPTVARALMGWPAWRAENLRAMKAGRLRWIAAGGESEQPTVTRRAVVGQPR